MGTSERKCDTCRFRGIDRFGDFCDNPRNEREYGLRSVYGWCEFYDKNTKAKTKNTKG